MLHNVSGINFLVLSVNRIPVSLSLTCLFMLLPHFSYHIFSRCQLTTVAINNPLSLSLPAQNLPLSQSLGHPCKFQRVSRLGSVTARHSSSGRQPNFAALNRGRHLYSTGWPSRWALAHILVVFSSFLTFFVLFRAVDQAGYSSAFWRT